MADFYNGNKLLSLKTLSGGDPEVFFCVGNRSAGKTFFFKRWLVRRFMRYGEKFVVFLRVIDDTPSVAQGFWADIGPIAFPGHEMTQRPLLSGRCAELLLDGVPCGYVVPYADRNVDRIKRNSSLFADAERGFLDEFASETGSYLKREVSNFNSARLSIARGGAKGTHTRYFPCYLCSNRVSMFNPFFDYFRVAGRLQANSHYVRGDNWVLELTHNDEAAAAIRSSFGSLTDQELDYAAGRSWLLDTKQFVRDLPGPKWPMVNIRYNNKLYSVWEVQTTHNILVSRKLKAPDKRIIAFARDDHDEDSELVTRSSVYVKMLRQAYMDGLVWFESGACKAAFLDAVTRPADI